MAHNLLPSPVMLFDGKCFFCNAAVNFIIRFESTPVLRFTSLQSLEGEMLLEKAKFPVPKGDDVINIGSFIIVDTNCKAHTRFAACLVMFDSMGGIWRLFGKLCGVLVPPFIGNVFYDLGWKYRYLILGRSSSCILPTQELKLRLIDENFGQN